MSERQNDWEVGGGKKKKQVYRPLFAILQKKPKKQK